MSYDVPSLKHKFVEQWHDIDVKLLALTLLPLLMTSAVSEAAIFYGYTTAASCIYLFALLFCLLVPLQYEASTGLLTAFGLLPLFRLVNLGMPTFFELTLLTLPTVYLPTLAAILIIVRGHEDISIKTNPRMFLMSAMPAIGISLILAVAEYTIIEPESLVPESSMIWFVIAVSVLVLIVAPAEELLFRGVMQETLSQYLGQAFGIVLASILFGMMHSIYNSGTQIVFATAVGVVLGVIYEWTDSIELVVLIHGIHSLTLFVILPFYGLV